MIKTTYDKIKVEHFSLTTMQEAGFDIQDDTDIEKEFMNKLLKKGLFKYLTIRQQQILICLERGLTRQETASHLVISRQSVNQIIPRIRKRLKAKGISYEKNIKGGSRPRISVFPV